MTVTSAEVPADAVPDVAVVAVERLDVVAVGVEEVGGVVAGRVVAVARLSVRAEPCLDPCLMETVDLLARARVEAEVEVCRRRLPVGNVEVREPCPVAPLTEFRDPERCEHRLVKPNAL